MGIEIDTVLIIARLPVDKLERAIQATSIVLAQTSITLELAENLSGFLTFCANVIQLRMVYMWYI